MKGMFEGEYVAYMVVVGSTVVDSTLGVPTVTTYVESSAVIKEGGSTGITAVVVGATLRSIVLHTGTDQRSSMGDRYFPGLVGVQMMKVVRDILEVI